MTQEKGDAYCWFKETECTGCFYCLSYSSNAQYHREYWGGQDCPACSKTLDETGQKHEDGSWCS